MKNIVFYASILSAGLLFSCSKDQMISQPEESTENLVTMEFTATAQVQTKTQLTDPDGDGKFTTVEWLEDDAISVWDGVKNRKFTMKSINGKSAVFTGQVSAEATSFYGIYPYMEQLEVSKPDNEAREIRFRFPMKEIQNATPGNFDRDAAFAVAAASMDKTFKFQNRTVMLKFSLAEDMNDIQAVTVSGNKGEPMAGTANLELTGNQVAQGIVGDTHRKDQVMLKAPEGEVLQTGVNYYIVLTGQKFAEGLTVNFLTKDQEILTLQSTASVQFYTRQIHSLSDTPISRDRFQPDGPVEGLLKVYNAGEDIIVGGKTLNIKTDGVPTVIAKAGSINAGGLYFIDTDQEITLTNSSLTDLTVIGNQKTKAILVYKGITMKEGQSVLLYNVELKPDATMSGKDILNETKYIQSAIFDNCKLYYPKNRFVLYSGGSDPCSIKEFKMLNSDFVLGEMTSNQYMFNNAMPEAEIVFKNNIFYTESASYMANKFKVINATTSRLASLVFNDNTIINANASGAGTAAYFTKGLQANYIEVKNNLFYAKKLLRNEYIFNEIEGSPESVVTNNWFWKEEGNSVFKSFNRTPTTWTKADAVKMAAKSPFTSMDFANGIFLKDTEFATIGGIR